MKKKIGIEWVCTSAIVENKKIKKKTVKKFEINDASSLTSIILVTLLVKFLIYVLGKPGGRIVDGITADYGEASYAVCTSWLYWYIFLSNNHRNIKIKASSIIVYTIHLTWEAIIISHTYNLKSTQENKRWNCLFREHLNVFDTVSDFLYFLLQLKYLFYYKMIRCLFNNMVLECETTCFLKFNRIA